MSKFTKWPIGLNIVVKRLDEKRWELKYTEKFDPKDKEAAQNTVDILRKTDLTILFDEKRCEIHIKTIDTKEIVFGFLAEEFLANSKVAQMNIGDLMALAGAFFATQNASVEK